MARVNSIEISAIFAKRSKLSSVYIDVIEVHGENPKSFEVTVRPVYVERSACWRCAKVIIDKKSIHFGVGPDCADVLGIPYREYTPEDVEIEEMRISLPKSFLTETQILELQQDSPGETEDEALVAQIVENPTTISMSLDWVNKHFVKDLQEISGWTWDAKAHATHFNKTDEVLLQLTEVLNLWHIKMRLDDLSSERMAVIRSKIEAGQLATRAMGAEEVHDLKYATIDVDKYDWGLQGIRPRQYQAQAIAFACSLFGVELQEL